MISNSGIHSPATPPQALAAAKPHVEVTDLHLHYPIYKGLVRRKVGAVQAVTGVNLTIHQGETLGVVGESGCGKTSLGRLITRLLDPTGGHIYFHMDGGPREITRLSQAQLKPVRRQMGMVFQDPYSSLNPRMSVGDIIAEPLHLHGLAQGKAREARVGELLTQVGLSPEHQERFPHAFSGGQRQRIAIARALATSPRFLVADEPVSALDVSVQSQVLNLLLELQAQQHLTMMFIAHDLTVVRHVSDRIAVMYLGEVVEIAKSKELCDRPHHPYTEGLLASIPLPEPGAKSHLGIMRGEPPDASKPPQGCRFHPRCRYRQAICEQQVPALLPIQKEAHHSVACHFRDELALSGVNELLGNQSIAKQSVAGMSGANSHPSI